MAANPEHLTESVRLEASDLQLRSVRGPARVLNKFFRLIFNLKIAGRNSSRIHSGREFLNGENRVRAGNLLVISCIAGRAFLSKSSLSEKFSSLKITQRLENTRDTREE